MRVLLRRPPFLVSFVLLNSLMGVSVGLAKVTAPLYALHLGASEGMLSLLAGAQNLGVLLMSLPIGFLVERHGPVGLFVSGSFSAALLYALLPLVPSPPFLLVGTVVIGLFMPFRFVTLNTLFLEQLTELGESKAGWARGSHMAGTSLIGPALAAYLVLALDYRLTYWLIALLFLVTGFMAPLVFGGRERARAQVRPIALEEVKRQLLLIARDAELRGACLLDFTGQAIMLFYTFFIVVIAVTTLGLGSEQASGLVGAQGLSYVLALFTLGPLATRLGPVQVHVVCALLIGSGLLLLGMASEPLALWLGGLVLGIGLGLLQIVNLMRFARIGARVGRGKIAGVNALVGPAGGMAGSLGGGLVGQQLGLQTVFLLFIPVLLTLLWQLHVRGALLVAEAR